VPESPTAVTQSADPNPPSPPGLRRSVVIALAIGMVVALAAIAVTAVRTATSESAPVPATSTPNRDGNSNQDPHNTATVDPNARSGAEAAVQYGWQLQDHRSEEHTSELQSRI